MRLVLHIGMAKTGTSTLQQTLGQHARLLARSKILYPTARTRPSAPTAPINHNVLACCVKDPERIPRRFRSEGASDSTSIRKMGTEFWAAVGRDVGRKRPRHVVLSGESLFYLRQREIDRLHALVKDMFDEIDVIAYVREPASYYLAAMQQAVRGSYTITPPSSFHLPMKSLLSRYLEVFDERVTVRGYDRATLTNGCVVQDFLHAALPDPSALLGQISVADRNESLPAEAVWIMRNLRRYGWPDDDDRLMPESTLVAITLRKLRATVPSSPLRLRPGIAAGIRRTHRADLEWLKDRFDVHLVADEPPTEREDEPDGWRSQDLEEILELDRQHLERTTYALVKELAARSVGRRSSRLGRFLHEGPAARVLRPLRHLQRGRPNR